MALSRRLTSLDASFLYLEKSTEPMHVGSVGVYEGRVTRGDMTRILNERLHLLPRYRQKVVFSPWGIAHPTWEDDPNFEVGDHVKEATLPKPGDDKTLGKVGGELYASLLSRDQSPWEMVIIHGHKSGNTYVISKVHHCMVDGVSGVDLTMLMHDMTRDAAPPVQPPDAWSPPPLPDQLSLLQDAVTDQVTSAANRFTDQLFSVFRPGEVRAQADRIRNVVNTATPMLRNTAPPVPWVGRVSGEREFAWLQMPFAEIREIRSALGGTVNDVVLTIISGALGRYLRAHDYDTAGIELKAMCPVSMRKENQQGALGNLVSAMIAPLFVGIDDPVERLKAERDGMNALKEQDQAGGLYELTRLNDQVPPMMQAFFSSQRMPANMQPPLHTVSTNVPGPQIPLYMAGHELLTFYPLGICSGNIGLFNAILSYNQMLTIGPTVDPQLVPDVWFYIDCLRESFDELLGVARQAAATQGPPPVEGAAPVTAAVDGAARRSAASRSSTNGSRSRRAGTRRTGSRRSTRAGRTTRRATTASSRTRSTPKRSSAGSSGGSREAAATSRATRSTGSSTSGRARAARTTSASSAAKSSNGAGSTRRATQPKSSGTSARRSGTRGTKAGTGSANAEPIPESMAAAPRRANLRTGSQSSAKPGGRQATPRRGANRGRMAAALTRPVNGQASSDAEAPPGAALETAAQAIDAARAGLDTAAVAVEVAQESEPPAPSSG